jgi:hypothetical protein
MTPEPLDTKITLSLKNEINLTDSSRILLTAHIVGILESLGNMFVDIDHDILLYRYLGVPLLNSRVHKIEEGVSTNGVENIYHPLLW